MTLLNSNSGIITDIKPVITSSFTNITLWYESNNGYCCLYKAQKSGKYHILKTLKPIYKDNPVYQGVIGNFAVSKNGKVNLSLSEEQKKGIHTFVIRKAQ